MNKTLAGLFLAVALLAPSFSYAQEVPATTTDLDSLKVQLINLLMEQVQILQAQLTALQSDVNDVKTHTTSQVSTGGSVDNTVSADWNVSAVITPNGIDEDGNHTYIFTVSGDGVEKIGTTLTEEGTNWLVIGGGLNPVKDGAQTWDSLDLTPGNTYTWKVVSEKGGQQKTNEGSFVAQ